MINIMDSKSLRACFDKLLQKQFQKKKIKKTSPLAYAYVKDNLLEKLI